MFEDSKVCNFKEHDSKLVTKKDNKVRFKSKEDINFDNLRIKNRIINNINKNIKNKNHNQNSEVNFPKSLNLQSKINGNKINLNMTDNWLIDKTSLITYTITMNDFIFMKDYNRNEIAKNHINNIQMIFDSLKNREFISNLS